MSVAQYERVLLWFMQASPGDVAWARGLYVPLQPGRFLALVDALPEARRKAERRSWSLYAKGEPVKTMAEADRREFWWLDGQQYIYEERGSLDEGWSWGGDGEDIPAPPWVEEVAYRRLG